MTPDNIFLLLALGALLFYMLFQSRKRKKAALDLFNAIAPGDKVVLFSGIVGTVKSLEDTEIIIESTPGSTVRVLRQSVRVREAAATEEI